MVDRLIEYLGQLYQEKEPANFEAAVRPFTLQNIAICATWYEGCARDPSIVAKWAAIPKAIALWSAQTLPRISDTEGRRRQWLLRELIQELQAGKLDSLGWDELTFLHQVHRLATGSAEPTAFARPVELLTPYLDAVETQRKSLNPIPELPGLSARLHIITPEDIEKAPARQISLFAGIRMPSLGPVLTHPGHLVVLGSVPENGTVVVEKGSCSVEGFVMGRIAVRLHCDIQENISGVVVAREGEVRARNIVNRAYVVSKWSGIHCRQAQDPSLVFAGSEIRIRGQAVMGTYIAPRIEIEEEARGGVYHTTKLVRASRFSHTAASEAKVVLRRQMSWTDYGETGEDEWAQLVRQGSSIQRRLADLRARIQQVEEEIESLAESVVLYAYVGSHVQQHIERLQTAQWRLAFLRRLVAGLDALAAAAEERLQPAEPAELVEETSPGETYSNVDEELRMLVAEEAVEQDLLAAVEEMARLRSRLDQIQRDKKRTSLLLMRIRTRLDQCTKDIEQLWVEIGHREEELKRAADEIPFLRDWRNGVPKVQMLRKLLDSTAGKPQDDPIVRKINSNFVQPILRKTRSLTQISKRYRKAAQTLHNELEKIIQRLKERHEFVASAEAPLEQRSARAVGRFEAGVKIYADPFFLGESVPPPGSVLITTDSHDAVKTYVRGLSGVFEEKS